MILYPPGPAHVRHCEEWRVCPCVANGFRSAVSREVPSLTRFQTDTALAKKADYLRQEQLTLHGRATASVLSPRRRTYSSTFVRAPLLSLTGAEGSPAGLKYLAAPAAPDHTASTTICRYKGLTLPLPHGIASFKLRAVWNAEGRKQRKKYGKNTGNRNRYYRDFIRLSSHHRRAG